MQLVYGKNDEVGVVVFGTEGTTVQPGFALLIDYYSWLREDLIILLMELQSYMC